MTMIPLFATNDFSYGGLYYSILGGDSVEVGTNSGISGNVVIPAIVSNNDTQYRVVAIGTRAFSNCTGLTSVDIPNSVRKISYEAFDATGLTTITIGENVSIVENNAFSWCSQLTTVYWNAVTCNDCSPFDSPVTKISSVLFGNDVKRIPGLLCSNMTKLTEITIPSKVSSIGINAFQNCSNLKTIYWNSIHCNDLEKPEWFYSYPKSAIFDNTPIERVIFGENVEYLPSYSFCALDNSFHHVTLYPKLIGFGENSIDNFLDSIEYKGNLKQWCETNYNKLSSLLYNATLLIQGVEMDSLIIPEDILSIHNTAFYGCKNISSITFISATPPTIEEYSFHYSIPLYVPFCAYLEYTSTYASNWRNYYKQIRTHQLYNIELTSNDENLGTVYITSRSCENNTITISAIPNYECKFVRWSDNNTDNPRTLIIDSDIELTAYFIPIEETGFENIHTDGTTPYKTLSNGQLYIIRGDKTYTLQGQEIK